MHLPRPFQLVHQHVSITEVSLEKKQIIGAVELTIVPTQRELREVHLNARQCRISRIVLNDDCVAPFTYFDPMMTVCEEDLTTHSLNEFSKSHLAAVKATDPDANAGELVIAIPPDGFDMVQEGCRLRIRIDFSLVNPQSGMRFIDKTLEECYVKTRISYPYMYTEAYENSTRVWLPCVDTYSAPCTWTLQISVERGLKAVSCGDLVKIVHMPNSSKTTYHYSLKIPACAPNIALAVGPFKTHVDPKKPKVAHYSLPGLYELVKNTVSFIPAIFDFFEEVLSTAYPFGWYRQLFVHNTNEDIRAYSSMSIASVNLLHSKSVIDQTYISRTLMAHAVAQQFFGCLITAQSSSDIWVTKGIAGYLNGLHIQKMFGNNPYREWIQSEMELVVQYEKDFGGIVLDCSQHKTPESVFSINPLSGHNEEQINEHYFPIESFHTASPKYLDTSYKKAHLVIRMLEHQIEKEFLHKVLYNLLALAKKDARSELPSQYPRYPQSLISTNSFNSSIFAVTGRCMSLFMDEWVRTGGHASISLNYVYNRRHNSLETEIRQDFVGQRGVNIFSGPLVVQVQELDKPYKHTLHIGNALMKETLFCHSKFKRNKHIKITLCTGEDVEMDLSPIVDCPVLWIRVDTEMLLIREVNIEQTDFQWQYQLRHERDVTAQLTAIKVLEKHPTQATTKVLIHAMQCNRCYYKVRCAAAHCLVKVATQMKTEWSEPPPLLSLFCNYFAVSDKPDTIKPNDFSNFRMYFLKKAFAAAMGGFRNSSGICPPEVEDFLLKLIEVNSNHSNYYDDTYYKASIFDGLSASVSPKLCGLPMYTAPSVASATLANHTKIYEEANVFLYVEKTLPTYNLLVSCSCLKVQWQLQKCGHFPLQSGLFRKFSTYGYYSDLRISAVECLLEFARFNGAWEDFDHLIKLLEGDRDPGIRHALVQLLIKNPPFAKDSSSALNRPELAKRLWNLLTTQLPFESKLRAYVSDLYYVLYGSQQPQCLSLKKASKGPDKGTLPKTTLNSHFKECNDRTATPRSFTTSNVATMKLKIEKTSDAQIYKSEIFADDTRAIESGFPNRERDYHYKEICKVPQMADSSEENNTLNPGIMGTPLVDLGDSIQIQEKTRREFTDDTLSYQSPIFRHNEVDAVIGHAEHENEDNGPVITKKRKKNQFAEDSELHTMSTESAMRTMETDFPEQPQRRISNNYEAEYMQSYITDTTIASDTSGLKIKPENRDYQKKKKKRRRKHHYEDMSEQFGVSAHGSDRMSFTLEADPSDEQNELVYDNHTAENTQSAEFSIEIDTAIDKEETEVTQPKRKHKKKRRRHHFAEDTQTHSSTVRFTESEEGIMDLGRSDSFQEQLDRISEEHESLQNTQLEQEREETEEAGYHSIKRHKKKHKKHHFRKDQNPNTLSFTETDWNQMQFERADPSQQETEEVCEEYQTVEYNQSFMPSPMTETATDLTETELGRDHSAKRHKKKHKKHRFVEEPNFHLNSFPEMNITRGQTGSQDFSQEDYGRISSEHQTFQNIETYMEVPSEMSCSEQHREETEEAEVHTIKRHKKKHRKHHHKRY